MIGNYLLKLEKFEGPLDLLLHLIRLKEVDVFSVDLAEMAEQYLGYLRLIKFANLRTASAFLAMAATLCEIKSLRLLPSAGMGGLEEEEQEASNIEAALRERLQEYQAFKEAAILLNHLRIDNGRTFPNTSEARRIDSLLDGKSAELRGEAPMLLVLYEQLLTNVTSRKPLKVKTERELIAIENIIQQLQEKLEKAKFIVFQEMYKGFKNRYELVVHLLALLQLVHDLKELSCHQASTFAPLCVYKKDDDKKIDAAFLNKLKETNKNGKTREKLNT